MRVTDPRLVIAGLAGDSGKTLVSLGLARALTGRGLAVSPFKKGPDYIDAAWLGVAASRPGRNLDTYMMTPGGIAGVLERRAPSDLMLVEGNRGLHDGMDASGTHSTAELAKLLGAPVVLVIDVTKMTRTAAALVLGCRSLDPELRLEGVVLNRVATPRQEQLIREAVETASGLPVLGAIPRQTGDPLPGRHLGLVTAQEHPATQDAVERASSLVSSHLDLDGLLRLARSVEAVELPAGVCFTAGDRVRIGVFRDQAFSFYYPENLEALEESGAELVEVAATDDDSLPPGLDALYLGGGFPEVHAERLSGNRALREDVKAAASRGLPIYAECGGLMYLARELRVGGTSYPMAGVLDLVVEQTPRPSGHGYVSAEIDGANPFFETGTMLRGHEFHYSRVVSGEAAAAGVCRLDRGQGVRAGRDGLVVGRVWASYLHLHALATPAWVEGFMALARGYRRERSSMSLAWG